MPLAGRLRDGRAPACRVVVSGHSARMLPAEALTDHAWEMGGAWGFMPIERLAAGQAFHLTV